METLDIRKKSKINKALKRVRRTNYYHKTSLKINILIDLYYSSYDEFVSVGHINYIYNMINKYNVIKDRKSLIKGEYIYYFEEFNLPEDVCSKIDEIYNNAVDNINTPQGQSLIEQNKKLNHYYRIKTLEKQNRLLSK